MSTEPAAARHEKKILAAILFLALALRLWGIQFGLPGLFHADEPIVLNHALAYGTGDFNPHFFKIPPLVSYLLFAVFGVYYLTGKLLGHFSGTADFENLFYTDPSSFYLLARLVFGALAGTLTVWILFGIIRRHFGAARALTASFLLAVCFLHVSDSHYLYADIPLLLVMVLAFGMFWSLDHAAGVLNALTSGALIGLAAALKYNGLFAGLFYSVMLLGTDMRISQKVKNCLLAAGASAVVFSLLNPYWLLDFNFFVEELKKQSLSQGGMGWLHHGVYSLPGAVGVPILLAALAGALAAVLDKTQIPAKRLKRWALLIFTMGYYAVLAYAGQPYPRYVLPLLPGVIFFAVDFICQLTEKTQRSRLFGVLVLFCTAFPFTKAVLWDHLMSAPDVRSQAKDWVEIHIPLGASLALDWDFYMPRLNFTAEQLQDKKNQIRQQNHFREAQMRRLDALIDKQREEPSYELHFLVPSPESQERFLMASPVLPYNLNALKADNTEYVLLIPGVPQGDSLAFYKAVQREMKQIRVFSPYRDGRLEPIDSTAMTGGPFTWSEIAARKANGHAISIYHRVEKGAAV